MWLLSAVDLLAAPPLGYLRDHLLAWKEGSLLPLLLVTHVICAAVLVSLAARWQVNQPDRRNHVLWGALLSSPAIVLAFVLDEFLYMQIRY